MSSLVALGGLLRYVAFPLGVVSGGIGIFVDDSKWPAVAATIVAAVFTAIVFLL